MEEGGGRKPQHPQGGPAPLRRCHHQHRLFRGIALIDVRPICSEDGDYAGPIEPSVQAAGSHQVRAEDPRATWTQIGEALGITNKSPMTSSPLSSEIPIIRGRESAKCLSWQESRKCGPLKGMPLNQRSNMTQPKGRRARTAPVSVDPSRFGRINRRRNSTLRWAVVAGRALSIGAEATTGSCLAPVQP